MTRLSDFFPGAPIAALTATADEATRQDIADKLFPRDADGSRRGNVIVSGFDRPNIRLSVAQRQDWKKQLLDFVDARRDQSGIVYCLSRRKTEEVTEFLKGQWRARLCLSCRARLDRQGCSSGAVHA